MPACISRLRSLSARVSKNHRWNLRSLLARNRCNSTTAWKRLAPAADRSVICLFSVEALGTVSRISSVFCSSLCSQ